MRFFWGTATSAYQVEGSTESDGRVPSIWDTFCAKPNTILDRSSGQIAADHYKRWKTDLALMKELGVNAYRFSIAWPRAAKGKQGLAFYEKLVDSLLEAGIEPFATLYHWDLPQYLQDKGGWASRETCQAFTEYAQLAYETLGNRVKYWITFNEPYITSIYGHLYGNHAPGIKDLKIAMAAAHHQLLAHGMAVQAIRNESNKIGIALNLAPIIPANEQSKEAAHYFDLVHDRFYLDGLYKGKYPPEMIQQMPWITQFVFSGDMEVISTQTDFLGINYYSPIEVETDNSNVFGGKTLPHKPNPYSQMFTSDPTSFKNLLTKIWNDYHSQEIFITENGTSIEDIITRDGKIHDFYRKEYLRLHIEEMLKAKSEGVPISGYFAWSLMDNFEWALGYQRRFGLTYVDFISQQRILKDSGLWYRDFIKQQE